MTNTENMEAIEIVIFPTYLVDSNSSQDLAPSSIKISLLESPMDTDSIIHKKMTNLFI